MTMDSLPYHGSRLDASLQLGQKISDEWGTKALMVQMSRDITKEWNTRTRLDEARAIQSWINRHVRYVPDPIGAEMISDPLTTLKNGGDCDDQSVLAAALLQAHGHDARIAAVTWEGRNEASHAVVVDLTASCVVDPISVSPEAWPPAGYKVHSMKFLNKAGQMETMNGLFSKLIKAVAKPFQKIFPAHTLLGKIADPLGLTDPKRNLNLVGRVADVVGTAAALAAGGYALGAATGATGGFWSTTAAGFHAAGAGAWKGIGYLASGTGTALKTLAPLALMSGGGSAQGQGGMTPDQVAAWQNYGNQPIDMGSGTGMVGSGGIGYSGSGGGGSAGILPDEGFIQGPAQQMMKPGNLIPVIAVVAIGLIVLNKKKTRRRR